MCQIMSSSMNKKDPLQERHKPSLRQERSAVNFIQKHPILLQSKQLKILNREKIYKLWIEMAKELNSIEGVKKSPTGWLRHWIDKKRYVSVKHRRIMSGVPNLKLSPLEKKILILSLHEKKNHTMQIKHSELTDNCEVTQHKEVDNDENYEEMYSSECNGTKQNDSFDSDLSNMNIMIEVMEQTADHHEVTQHKEDDNYDENYKDTYNSSECIILYTEENNSFESGENDIKMIEDTHELTADNCEVTQHKEDDNDENYEETCSNECNGTKQNNSFKSDENDNKKLIEVMANVMEKQSIAFAEMAQTWTRHSSAIERLADASYQQAVAVNKLANSIESIGASLSDMKSAVVSIEDVLKRSLLPDQKNQHLLSRI